MGGTPCWSRVRVRSHPLEEEEATQTMCYEMTTTPIPHPPVPLGGEEAENL